MVNLNFKQLGKVIDEEKKFMADEERKALIAAKMQSMYSPDKEVKKDIKWQHATFFWPRTKLGPENEEIETIKNIGGEGWEMVGFQIYDLDHPTQTHMVEYVFKKLLE